MAQDRDKQMPEKYGCICSALHTEREPNLESRVIQFSNGFFRSDLFRSGAAVTVPACLPHQIVPTTVQSEKFRFKLSCESFPPERYSEGFSCGREHWRSVVCFFFFFFKLEKLPPAFRHVIEQASVNNESFQDVQNTKLELTILTAEHQEESRGSGGYFGGSICVCVRVQMRRGGGGDQSSVLCNTKAFREALLPMLHLKQINTDENYTFFQTPLLPLINI